VHIIVCVKQVPDATQVRIDPETNTLDRSSAPAILNPYDEHAVEAAVAIKKHYGGKVSVISMGPMMAKDVIKKCISMGADAGYLLSDRSFAGSDTLATSYILTMGIKKIMEADPVDIVICGKQAVDGDTAQVGPGIARRLNFPVLTYVQKIDTVESGSITVQRKMDNGHEVVECKLPCLLTVEKEINELSYASLPEMIRAAQYDVVTWGANVIQADTAMMGLKGSPTSVRKIFAPPERKGGIPLQGDAKTVAATIVSQIMEKLA
jgi:electron transfer flavoprotein beta subunit